VTDALKNHWPEYLIKGACLGLFMISAFTFGTILEHPASLVHRALPNALLRRFLMGSPWAGRRSAPALHFSWQTGGTMINFVGDCGGKL